MRLSRMSLGHAILCDGGIDRRQDRRKECSYGFNAGDLRFFRSVRKLGCHVTDTEAGIEVTGTNDGHYPGITVDMNDFFRPDDDACSISSIADSPTTIRNIGHIRLQESDRLSAIAKRINKKGILGRRRRRFFSHLSGEYHSHHWSVPEDHRMAMAFSPIGF